MASHGLPPSSVASAAMTATYGGAELADPIPAGWNPCRYSCHSRGCAAPGRAECPARQRSRGEQRALRDQRDRGQPGEQQHAGIGQDALRQPAVDEQRSPRRRPDRRWRDGCPRCRSGWTWDRRWRRTRPAAAASGRVAARCAAGRTRRGGRGPGAAARPAAGTAAPSTEPHRGELVQGRVRPLGEQEEHRAQRRTATRLPASDGGRRGQREVGQQGEQRVAPVSPARPRRRPTGTGGAAPPPPGGRRRRR